jgi:tRNA-2-methylthio-N6-dimethylallyladenosine synthase
MELVINKVHDEHRQGEAFAPFVAEVNNYQRKFYIESYGCQMNFADSEIVASILNESGFGATRNYEEADLVLLNPRKSRTNDPQQAAYFQAAKTQSPGYADRRSGLYGRTA